MPAALHWSTVHVRPSSAHGLPDGSNTQVLEQQSPLMTLPSSHASPDSTKPLPQPKRAPVKGPPQCTLLIHPDDAAARALAHGACARVESKAGVVTANVEVTDSIMPGVVSLPHGWGHDREGTRMAVARQSPGVSVNDVTSEFDVDTLTGTAAFNGLVVCVTAV